jgi:HK97 family phage prohead protease
MLHKSFDIIDAKADAEAGTFEATVAVFGNVDRGGDRIIPGAFDRSLAAWKAAGDPIPVILSHQWDNPMAHIGVVDDAKETSKGLWVKGTLDVADNDVARQVHRLMKRRSLKEFSFGYSVPKGGSKRAKDGANELREIELSEVGPTLKGMNPATELHAVKSALGVEETPRDAEELRKEADRVAREQVEAGFPDVPPAEPKPKVKASGMAGVLERMATLVDRQEAPTEDEALALARYIMSQFAADKSTDDIETFFKAVWTAAYVNDLPDSSFLYVEPGGEKDEDGKTTPRSLRHFPVKDANGTVDLPHLRNALARIPQSSLPQAVKDRVTAAAQRMLDDNKTVDEADKETKSRSVDPLRRKADAVALEFATEGLPHKPPVKVQQKLPEPNLPLAQLKQRMRDEMLMHLSGEQL